MRALSQRPRVRPLEFYEGALKALEQGRLLVDWWLRNTDLVLVRRVGWRFQTGGTGASEWKEGGLEEERRHGLWGSQP